MKRIFHSYVQLTLTTRERSTDLYKNHTMRIHANTSTQLEREQVKNTTYIQPGSAKAQNSLRSTVGGLDEVTAHLERFDALVDEGKFQDPTKRVSLSSKSLQVTPALEIRSRSVISTHKSHEFRIYRADCAMRRRYACCAPFKFPLKCVCSRNETADAALGGLAVGILRLRSGDCG